MRSVSLAPLVALVATFSTGCLSSGSSVGTDSAMLEVEICSQVGTLDRLLVEAKMSRTRLPQDSLEIIREISEDAHELSRLVPDDPTYLNLDTTATAMFTRASMGETSWLLDLVELETACEDMQLSGL